MIDNIDIIYITAFYSTDEHAYQVITWTLATKFDENEAELRKVINSFSIGK